MSNDSTVNDVFDAFIKASEALKELPSVKATLENVTADRDGALHQLEAAESVIKSHEDEIAALKAKIEQTEAALSDATFRHREVSTTLDNLRGILGVVPVVESKPVGEVTPSAASTETQPVPESIPAVTGDEVASESGQGQSALGESYPPDFRPSHVELTLPVAAESTLIGMSQSVTTPSALPETHASDIVANSQPHLGQGYWLKPNDMSWDRWISLGGDKAPWMN